jgi:hypothetical protein
MLLGPGGGGAAALFLSKFKIDRNNDCNVKTRPNKITLEVPMAVDCNVMKGTSSWDVTSCNPVVHRRFGGTYCAHFCARKVSQESNLSLSRAMSEMGFQRTVRSALFGLCFNPEDGGGNFLWNLGEFPSHYMTSHDDNIIYNLDTH